MIPFGPMGAELARSSANAIVFDVPSFTACGRPVAAPLATRSSVCVVPISMKPRGAGFVPARAGAAETASAAAAAAARMWACASWWASVESLG
jgi:hypothetical protein